MVLRLLLAAREDLVCTPRGAPSSPRRRRAEAVVSGLRAAFDRTAADGRAALVAYVTFGVPDPTTSLEVIEAVCRAGADVIELGVPFSDPSADGPSIQRAMERALAAGATLHGALDGRRARGADQQADAGSCCSKANPISMGPAVFAARTAAAGVDAVLTVDLPIDELAELAGPLAARGVATIPLVAPTSTPDRIARLGALHAPFVYYISPLTRTVRAGRAGGASRLAAIRGAQPVRLVAVVDLHRRRCPVVRADRGRCRRRFGTRRSDRRWCGHPAR